MKSNRSLQTLLVLVILVIVGLVIYFAVDPFGGTKDDTLSQQMQEHGQSMYFDPDQIYKLSIETKDAEKDSFVVERDTLIEKELDKEAMESAGTTESNTENDDAAASSDTSTEPIYKEIERETWFITSPARYEGEKGTIDNLLNNLKGVEYAYPKKERSTWEIPEEYKEEDLDTYLQLNEPELKLTVYNKTVWQPEREFVLKAGTPKETNAALAPLYVVSISSDPDYIYFIEKTKLDAFKKNIKEIRRKDFIGYKENQVDKVVINDSTTFTKVKDTWVMAGHSEAECETNKIKSTVNSIVGVRASEFYDASTAHEQYGLTQPAYEIKIYRGQELLRTLYLNKITIPPETEEETEKEEGYAYMAGKQVIYQISGTNVFTQLEHPDDYYLKPPPEEPEQPETPDLTMPENIETPEDASTAEDITVPEGMKPAPDGSAPLDISEIQPIMEDANKPPEIQVETSASDQEETAQESSSDKKEPETIPNDAAE